MLARRTGQLHVYRCSQPWARYFVTLCTSSRRRGLFGPSVCNAIHAAVRASDAGNDTETIAFTVMGNHVHWLLGLGARLSLGRVVARFKVNTSAALASAGLSWQRDFFEHRLRPDENSHEYARYVFLNAYRAGLAREGGWHGWYTGRPDLLSFLQHLDSNGAPPLGWILEPGPKALFAAESPKPDPRTRESPKSVPWGRSLAAP